jgi:hypothetical protein
MSNPIVGKTYGNVSAERQGTLARSWHDHVHDFRELIAPCMQ